MMNTKIERVNPEQIDETIMEEAGRLIAEGELSLFRQKRYTVLAEMPCIRKLPAKSMQQKDVLRTTP